MRALLLALTAAVLGAPGAQAGDVWVSLQGGFQRHAIYQGEVTRLTDGTVYRSLGTPLERSSHPTGGIDVESGLGEHWALRGQLSYLHTGGGLRIRGNVQDLDLHLLEAAALFQGAIRFGYGDHLYVMAGPALAVRLNTPETLWGPVGNDLLPNPQELAEGWERLSLSAVLGGGLAIRPRGGRLGTFIEAQYRRGLNDLYDDPDKSGFAVDRVNRSRGWRFVTGLSIAVR
jgi:hypothetical protein